MRDRVYLGTYSCDYSTVELCNSDHDSEIDEIQPKSPTLYCPVVEDTSGDERT